jgi:hypothetical protein
MSLIDRRKFAGLALASDYADGNAGRTAGG